MLGGAKRIHSGGREETTKGPQMDAEKQRAIALVMMTTAAIVLRSY